jgi:hypothetical protein
MEQSAESTTSPAQPTDDLSAVPEAKGPLNILFGILIRPRVTFEALREAKRRHAWLVVILMIIATTLLAAANYSLRAAALANFTPPEGFTTPDGATVSPEDAQQMAATAASPVFLVVFPVIGGTVGVLLGYGFSTVVVFGLSLLMGGKATFGQLLPVAIWSTLPLVLRKIVHAAVTLISGRAVAAGFSGLLTFSEAASMPLLSTLLSQFDVYLLWSLILLGVGVAVTARVSRGKAVIIVATYVLLVVGLMAAGSAISSGLANLFGGGAAGPGGARGGPGVRVRGPRG